MARLAFASNELEVPIREIARRAGVGVATVYRHFPTKEALLRAAFAEQMASCASIVDEGLACDDSWLGLCLVIEKLMAVHALDRGFALAFTASLAPPAELAAERDRTVGVLLELIRRAKQSGRLRMDVTVEDLVLVLMANEGIRAESPDNRAAASRRFAALVLRSFDTTPALGALPPPVRPRQATRPPAMGGR